MTATTSITIRKLSINPGDILEVRTSHTLLPPGAYRVRKIKEPFIELGSVGDDFYGVQRSFLHHCRKISEPDAANKWVTADDVHAHLVEFTNRYLTMEQ